MYCPKFSNKEEEKNKRNSSNIEIVNKFVKFLKEFSGINEEEA